MLRGKGDTPTDASETTEAPSGLHGDGAPEGTRSVPTVVKTVLLVAFASTLYTALTLVRTGRGGTRQPAGLSGSGDEGDLRTTFRQLNMMGFEESDERGGEWRTCRAYNEGSLAPDKKVCAVNSIMLPQQ